MYSLKTTAPVNQIEATQAGDSRRFEVFPPHEIDDMVTDGVLYAEPAVADLKEI